MARVSVVVPTWNGRHLLAGLLAALDRQGYRDFETVVVDNGSTDGTREALAGRPGVRVVALGRNLGFAAAVNRGVAAARGELLVLLNNDMEPEPGFLGALVAAADAFPGAASFASRVLARDDPGRIDAAGDRLGPSGRATGIGRGERDGPRFDEPREVFGATAGAALWRRAAFEALGGLDEDFFAYVEDTDLSLRAQLAGLGCRYVPEARTLHVGSATLRGREDVRARLCLRNHVWLLVKDWPLALAWRHRGELVRGVAREARFAFGAARARHGAVRAAGLVGAALAGAALGVPRMLVRRRRVVRRVPAERIGALLG